MECAFQSDTAKIFSFMFTEEPKCQYAYLHASAKRVSEFSLLADKSANDTVSLKIY